MKKHIVIFALVLALLLTSCAKQPEAEPSVSDIQPIVTITPEPAEAPVLQDHSTPETPAASPEEPSTKDEKENPNEQSDC